MRGLVVGELGWGCGDWWFCSFGGGVWVVRFLAEAKYHLGKCLDCYEEGIVRSGSRYC